jgi:hypothetical protein
MAAYKTWAASPRRQRQLADKVTEPFERPLDRLLEGLRWGCSPGAYGLIPGETCTPDRWAAKCPLHPDVGYTLLVTGCLCDPGDPRCSCEPAVWCQVGCPEWAIKYTLLPDPEREREAERRSAVLLWAQSYRKRRAA